MSNSEDPDETVHWAVSYESVLFAKACGSERVKEQTFTMYIVTSQA